MSKIRLVCPQCGARYDVPLEVIPPEGRDVQCSHCTHTWFQDAESVQPAPQPREAEPVVEADPVDPAWNGPERSDAVEAQTDDGYTDDAVWPGVPSDEAWAESADDADTEEPAPQHQPVQPRSLPPEVTEVFRQEREHEARQREQSAPIESQPDLGLVDPPDDSDARRARAARERMAFVREAEAPASPPPAFVNTQSRRDLLPDVEEISETLRGSDRHADAARPTRPGRPGRPEPQAELQPRGGGFLRGFVLAVTVGAIAAALYVSAPQIIAQQPEAEALLVPYLDAIDDARLWLDGASADIRAALDDLAP